MGFSKKSTQHVGLGLINEVGDRKTQNPKCCDSYKAGTAAFWVSGFMVSRSSRAVLQLILAGDPLASDPKDRQRPPWKGIGAIATNSYFRSPWLCL